MNAFKQFNRSHLLWISASLPIAGGCLFYLKQNLLGSHDNLNLPNEYIYLPNEISDILFHRAIDRSDTLTQEIENTFKPNRAIDLDRFSSASESIFRIFSDLKAFKQSQQCDLNESVRLALQTETRRISFRNPIRTDKILVRINGQTCHFELEELMTHLLNCTLDVEQQSECAKYFTQQALALFEKNIDLNYMFFGPDHDIHSKARFDRFLTKRNQALYFQAILENLSCSKQNAMCLLDNGLLVLLHRLRELSPEPLVQGWIAKCLSLLSIHTEAHAHLYHTGWIGIFAKWLNSTDLRLCLEAAKTLHNLANPSKTLHRSIYLLNPLHHSQFRTDFDIVFIHGLQGGVFKTWRQSDEMKDATDYTVCWPMSWLPADFRNCRVLAIDYQTFLSNWNISCVEHAHTLKERSIQLMHELRDADVGTRPIIWVCHSMGGLLLKQMLAQLADMPETADDHKKSSKKKQQNNLLRSTKGIVFFSVPHKGSEMAVWSPNIQRIISPSDQVLELRKDSPMLLDLHRRFLDIVVRNKIECLSFGEGKQSTLLQNPVEFLEWKYLLVPEDSADPGIGQFIMLPEDHFRICKPKTKESDSYSELKKFIFKLIEVHQITQEPICNDLLLSSCIL